MRERLANSDHVIIFLKSYSFVDQAEERVLFDLESVLEKILVAPLKSNYTLHGQRLNFFEGLKVERQ